MKKVFIIGNGFDLNLGLPTSYSHFIQSDYFALNLGKGLPLFDYLQNTSIHKRWVDVELELVNYAKTNPDKDKFRKDYEKLRTELCEYIKNISVSPKKETSAYKLISEFYTDDDAIISFNYTDVCEKILEENNRKKNITYIHGLAKSNNIIFGVHDNFDKETKYPFLLKSHYTNTAGKEFTSLLSKADCFIFFGHSLGQTDHSYFQQFIGGSFLNSINSGKNLVFSYFMEEGRENLTSTLNNITMKQLGKLKQNMNYDDFDAANLQQMRCVMEKIFRNSNK